MVSYKMMKSNRIFAFFLSAVLLLDTTGIQTLAAQPKEIVMEDGDGMGTGDGEDTTDGEDVSGWDLSSGDALGDINPTILSEAATVEIIASGTYYGMNWTISGDGELTIGGVYSENTEGTSWHDYADKITGAKVNAVSVKSTQDWFRNLKKLKSVNFTEFDSGNVRNMNGMFYMCTSLETIKWGNIKTYNVTDMGFMFYGCKKLATLDVSQFDTAKVTNMRYMFSGCSALTDLAVNGFDTGNVTDMTGMFYNCCNVSRLNVGGFDTAKVTNMSYMFAECNAVKALKVSDFDTGSVTNMSSMFQNCSQVETLDVSNFDTGNVVHMSAMFYGCSSLTSLDVSSFETAYVTNMTHMFSDCRELEELKLGDFSTVRATDVDYMFYKCYKLKKLDLSGCNMLNVKSAEGMLDRCGALEELKTPTSLKVEVELPFIMQDAKGEHYTALPRNIYTSITLQHVPYGIELIADQVYTGKAIKPEVVVVKDGETLSKGVDYTVSYKNNVNVADAGDAKAPTVIVKGIGRYSGSFTGTFSIVAKRINTENTTVKEMIVKANNKVQTIRPVVTVDGKQLVFNKDYVVEYPDTYEGAYKEPGSYDVVIRGKCNYKGTYNAKLVILDADQVMASELSIKRIANCTYQEGEPAQPSPKVTYKGKELNLGEDYALTYENNDKPGKATVIITGLENTEGQFVSGTIKKSFVIKGTSLSKATFTYKRTALYTGFGIYPEISVTYEGKVLTEGKDYTLEYRNNVNVGTGRIIITGCGGYTGSVKKTFRIQTDFGVGDMLDISVGDAGVAEYCGNSVRPEVVVKLGNRVLQQGVDYAVYYHNNEAVAKANAYRAPRVVIRGRGNYKFTRVETFTIVEKSLEDKDITITVADKFSGASDLRSRPVITDGAGNTLRLGRDYTIVGYKVDGVDYNKNNIPADATRAIVTVKGKAGYTGEISAMYRITEKSIAKVNVTAQNLELNGDSAEYTPELIELGMLVLAEQKTNEELEYGVDYEIVGYKYNTRRGNAKVIIKGLGDYGGTISVRFKIVTKKIPL